MEKMENIFMFAAMESIEMEMPKIIISRSFLEFNGTYTVIGLLLQLWGHKDVAFNNGKIYTVVQKGKYIESVYLKDTVDNLLEKYVIVKD
jgi:hypothetical protein